MVVDIHRSSDGGLNIRSPHALELADNVNSEFFASVGNTLITSRETEDLVRTCYLPWVRQHLTAFDGDKYGGTATRQRTTGAAPQALFHRLRLRGDYCALTEFSWRYRPTASARRASPSGHGASGLSPCAGRSAGRCRYRLSKSSLRVQELSSFSLFFNTQILAVLSQQAVTSW